MRSVIACAAFIAASVVGSTRPLGAQTDTAHARTTQGRLIGVYDADSGAPIDGAEVSDQATGDHVLTTRTGTATLSFVRARESIIQVRKLGYEPWKQLVDVTAAAPITVVLMHTVIELGAVVTNAKAIIEADSGLRSGFDRRCAAAPHISCMTDSLIQADVNSGIGRALLRTGAVKCDVRGGHCELGMSGTLGGTCTPTVYVDGLVWTMKGVRVIDPPSGPPTRGSPAAFNASNVAKIEVYQAGMPRPMRWAGDLTCGAIVLWTK